MNTRVLLRILVLLLLGFGLPAQAGLAASLQALEGIAAEAETLDSFLANDSLQQRYFEALADYQGSNVTLPAYQEILAQLKVMKREVPDLSARLWSVQQMGQRFSVDAGVKVSGRYLEPAKWEAFRLALEQKLSEQSADWSILTPHEREVKTDQIFASVAERKASLSQALVGRSKKEAERLRAEFFQTLKNDTQYRGALADTLLRALKSPVARSVFTTGEADLILSFFQDLKNPTAKIWANISPAAQGHVGEVTKLVPSSQELLGRKDIFPERLRPTRSGVKVPWGSAANASYDFVPLPRPFHALFKGMPIKECVGGADCALIHPERWLSAALPGTNFHFVERGGDYLGFVQMVPLRKEGKIYGSVDFGATALANPIFVRNGEGPPEKTILFREWLQRAEATKPAQWAGLVVSESRSINNAGVLDTVRRSPAYWRGRKLGENFLHTDPLASQIVKAAKRIKEPNEYSGNMILDGTLPNSGNLTLLDSTATLGAKDVRDSLLREPLDQKFFRNYFSEPEAARYPETVKALIERGQADDLLISEVLPKQEWAAHPELVEQLLAKNKASLDRAIVGSLLPKSHWADQTGWVETILARGNSDGELVQLLAQSPQLQHHPQWVDTILMRGQAEDEIFMYLIGEPVAGENPSWLEYLVKNSDANMKLDWTISTGQHWRDHPGLKAALGEKEVTLENLKNLFRSGFTFKQTLKILSRPCAEAYSKF